MHFDLNCINGGMAELCVKPVGNDAEIGFDALAEVDPDGHFFAMQHTMERYKSAFYAPLVADLANFGAWTEAGEKTFTPTNKKAAPSHRNSKCDNHAAQLSLC